MGGLTQANAGLYKNESAIKKTEASNQWNYYQAKSSKQNLAELAIELAPEPRKPFYVDEVKRYKGEKELVKKDAEKFEHESDEWSKKSDEQIHQHHRWAQATTALQISIALAAIALLTRSRRLQYGVYGLASLGRGRRRSRLAAHLSATGAAGALSGSTAASAARAAARRSRSACA